MAIPLPPTIYLCSTKKVAPAIAILVLEAVDASPLALEVLLPQRDLVVARADGQDVAAQRPADAPDRGVKLLEHARLPDARVGRVAGPDADGAVLGRAGDVALLQDGGAPVDVEDPVGVAREHAALLAAVLGRRGVPRPDLERVVAAARDEAALGRRRGVGADDAAGGRRGRPRDRVDALAVREESLVVKRVVLELEHRDVAVRRGAGQEASRLVRGPRHDVDRGLVESKVKDLLPRASLLAPDEHLAVVA